MPLPDALCELFAAQDNFGANGTSAQYIAKKRKGTVIGQLPWIVIGIQGGNRNRDLAGNDDSYVQSNVTFRVSSQKPGESATITQAMTTFLENYVGTTGDREIFGITCDEPVDDPEPPPSESDNWYEDKEVSALIEHGAA